MSQVCLLLLYMLGARSLGLHSARKTPTDSLIAGCLHPQTQTSRPWAKAQIHGGARSPRYYLPQTGVASMLAKGPEALQEFGVSIDPNASTAARCCKAYAPNEPVSGAFVSRTSTPESTSPSRRNFPRGRVDNNILSCTLVIQDFFLVQIAAFAVFSFIRSGPGAICNAISPFRTGRPLDLGRPAPSSTPAEPSLLLLRSFSHHCRYRSLPFVGQHG